MPTGRPKNGDNEVVRLNLTLDKEFFALLKEKAKKDYLQVGTWTQQFLKKKLIDEK